MTEEKALPVNAGSPPTDMRSTLVHHERDNAPPDFVKELSSRV
jgi:hypothetical protein